MVLTYAEAEAAALSAERAQGDFGSRICKVFSEDPRAPELWYGTYGNAPVEPGPAGYQFSNGETVAL